MTKDVQRIKIGRGVMKMPTFKDLTNETFGRLTIIERAANKGRYVCWKCRCECGNEVIVRADGLKSGDTKSCGCLHLERAHGLNFKHGLTGNKIHRAWKSMKTRCLNPNFKYYCNYGGRGIKICDEWLEFEPFLEYVSKLPHFNEEGYSLDRIDNDGDYKPGNVRWADRRTQNLNTRQNRLVEYDGELMTLVEASEKSGVAYDVLRRRLKRGDTGDRLFRPKDGGKRINNVTVEYQGELMTLAEAAQKSGIEYQALYKRYKSGDRGERLFRPCRKKS